MPQANQSLVLIVSRSVNRTQTISAMLIEAGYRVRGAGSDSETLEIIRDEIPDLVICELGDMAFDGLETCRWLRADERLAIVPILLIGSGACEVSTILGAFEVGVDDYVEMPFEPICLIAKAGRLVKVGRLPGEMMQAARVSGVSASEWERAEADRTELAAIVNSTADAVVSMSVDGVIRSWNQGAENLYGYSVEEAVGRPVTLIVPAELRDEPVICMERLRAGENVIDYETERVRKDGKRVPVSVTISALRNGSGQVIGASSIARDVSERKFLEERLRQAQKLEAMGRLAGGIAHDFNNCLTAIVGFSELMMREIRKGVYRGSRLEEILRAAARSRSLTDQLLAFSRKQVSAPKVLNLNSSIATMIGMLRRLITEDIQIQLKVERGLGFIRADPVQIEQLILNLAINARDSMPGGGVLTIETHNIRLRGVYESAGLTISPGEYVVLAFRDTGKGMDEETRLRLFEPFYTTKESGTGLGLATVHWTVEQLGGNIEVHSEVARGSTFKIYFPRVHETEDEIHEEPASEELVGGNETILLVEDDELVRAVVRETLELVGYKVLEASGVVDAAELSEIVDGRIDLLITDVVMPGMSGRELALHLRARRPGLRVLFVSGYAGREVLDQGMGESGADLVEKPFTPSKLTSKVRQLLTLGEWVCG